METVCSNKLTQGREGKVMITQESIAAEQNVLALNHRHVPERLVSLKNDESSREVKFGRGTFQQNCMIGSCVRPQLQHDFNGRLW